MTNEKHIPFTIDQLREIESKWPTPFYLYDEKGIRETARSLNKAFDWTSFRNFFAVKATPNPYILRILKEEGMGADCSSHAELEISRRVGLRDDSIMFTSNNTPAKEYQLARELNAIINLDDFSQIEYMQEVAGLPDLICCRYNPGELKSGNAIIGNPVEAKFGFTREQIRDGYKKLRDAGVQQFGLHTMVASNELRADFHFETAALLFDLAIELSNELDLDFRFTNLGGGLGIPYKPGDTPICVADLGARVHELYDQKVKQTGSPDFSIYMENGRFVTGPHGFLVTKVRHRKSTYRNYVGVDATMANLMRPGMYGAYHHITAVGESAKNETEVVDIVGSLCENNDKFAIQREIPKVKQGDLLVIHDAGAHGHAMGFQYNGKLRSAELLLKENGEVVEIRRAETLDDYFSTLDFSGLT